ncbi:MAG: dihydrouridine synthase [Deltaproteobacteria bacterium RIFOXYD12_FULL_50_9]|nr:MAG: dihydrouridine synthase [Deltaproteobacteria bacterium RIFOXYD12_FULL_50_9]
MIDKRPTTILPWQPPGSVPLMLAPMQGLTNRVLRGLFIEMARPDVVFTEYVKVAASIKRSISENDMLEITSNSEVPLVVQLIGSDTDALVAAAKMTQDLGVNHLNLNFGCPYGRMTGKSSGGGALTQEPVELAGMLSRLRQVINGSFSIKMRSGFDNPDQVFSLLAIFEDCGIDFLIIHPRTVQQRYKGPADHGITAEVVHKTALPVIANGDIFTAADGRQVLEQTKAAGLMLGRGAIADPFLFERLRGSRPEIISRETRDTELGEYLRELLSRYQKIFCGEQQVLCKMKEVLALIPDPDFTKDLRRLQRCKNIAHFIDLLTAIIPVPNQK